MPGPGSGQDGAKQEAPLDEVLRKAVAKPRLLATSDGGAVLIVALHCLMVKVRSLGRRSDRLFISAGNPRGPFHRLLERPRSND